MTKWGLGCIVLIILLLGVMVLYVVGLYNGLIQAEETVAEKWAQVESVYQRRADLIPNLVEVVKDYMSYEQETLEKVIQARSQAVSAGSPEEAIAAEGILSGALGKLFALMENYPDLKANENVSRLMEELSATENKISFSRQFYNDSVMALNNAVEAFPSNIVAGMFNFKPATYFEVAEVETATPKVDLR